MVAMYAEHSDMMNRRQFLRLIGAGGVLLLLARSGFANSTASVDAEYRQFEQKCKSLAGTCLIITARCAGTVGNDHSTSFVIMDNRGRVMTCVSRISMRENVQYRLVLDPPSDPMSDYTVRALMPADDWKAAQQRAQAHRPAPVASAPSGLQPKLQPKAPVFHSTDTLFRQYLAAIMHFNPKLSPETAHNITSCLLSFSQMHGVDPRLVMAMVLAESRFRPDAVSRVGAAGLGQLMPGTARGLGVTNRFDVEQNLEASIRLLRGHLISYAKRVGPEGVMNFEHIMLAMAAYNAGAKAVSRHGGVPPYRETQNYVRKVISYYKQLAGIR